MSLFNNTEKWRKCCYAFVPIFGSIVLIERYGRVIASIFLPFAVAYLVAKLLHTPCECMIERTHLSRRVVGVFTVLLFYAALSCILFALAARLVREAAFLSDMVGAAADEGTTKIAQMKHALLSRLPPSLASYVKPENVSELVTSFWQSIAAFTVGQIKAFAVSVPKSIVGIGVTILASCYFAVEPHGAERFILRRLPEKPRGIFVELKSQVAEIGGKYFRAYSTLAAITFCELLAGLLPLVREYALIAALTITLVDVLPVFGTGTILLPWAGIEWLRGNVGRGITLILLYVVITVVRQWAEPKILGAFIGISPPTALLCMYAGGKLFGIVGLFAVPFAAVIVKGMQERGTIRLYRELPKTPKERMDETREKYKRYRKERKRK